MKIKAVDLFSGCGGVSCGLSRSGFDVRAAVEIDKAAASTYLNYKPLKNVKVLLKDICEVSGKELLKAAKIKKNEIYLFAGCPPCQNFSMQNPENKKKTEGERKKLLFEYLRLIEELHPPFILMENVPGITTEFNANILNEFIRRLENKDASDEEKYVVVNGVLNAADYGVPQIRKRFVLHAVRVDIYNELLSYKGAFGLPKPTHCRKAESELLPWVTVEETIGDLPPIAAGETYAGSLGVLNHKCAGLSDKNLERMRYIRNHGGSRDSLPDDMSLECHKKKDDKGEVFSGHKDVYGIMDGKKPSPTMTGGCLCYSKGRYGHYSQDRAISIREAARFQTFPDDFEFSNNLSQAALQIGNAVPVKLVEASGKEFMQAIKNIEKGRKLKKVESPDKE